MFIPILFSVSYFFACFGVAFAAGKKTVSAQNIFHIAVIFTPLSALIIVALSPKKKIVQSKMIVCKHCGFDREGNHVSSPECDKKGIVVIEEPIYS
jgi:hypothetical protein